MHWSSMDLGVQVIVNDPTNGRQPSHDGYRGLAGSVTHGSFPGRVRSQCLPNARAVGALLLVQRPPNAQQLLGVLLHRLTTVGSNHASPPQSRKPCAIGLAFRE